MASPMIAAPSLGSAAALTCRALLVPQVTSGNNIHIKYSNCNSVFRVVNKSFDETFDYHLASEQP